MNQSTSIELNQDEIEFTAIRSSGPGGQHVNTSSTAVQLRFDIRASSLPPSLKDRLLRLGDQRINRDGVIVIKAQQERSQERNRQAALERLLALINKAAFRPKARVATRPTRASQRKRVEAKVKRGRVKNLRARPRDLD